VIRTRLAVSLITLALQTACTKDLAAAPTSAFPASDSTLAADDGARLAYTIDWPAGNGPFPAVVLVHGSGRVTRADHAMLARQFTAHGWAALRYDKRGVGESQGVYSGVGVVNSDSMFDYLLEMPRRPSGCFAPTR
jgi:predicted acyl esterase